jgi:hypothetical protein
MSAANGFVLISGKFCNKILYFEKKKIIVNVAVTINAPVKSITLDEFDFGISLIIIDFYLQDWCEACGE